LGDQSPTVIPAALADRNIGARLERTAPATRTVSEQPASQTQSKQPREPDPE